MAACWLHEFGHALTARRYGILTRDIILLPIGGVARLERIPENPRQELLVAAAGPLVNVAIAALLYGWLLFTQADQAFARLGVSTGPLLDRLLVVNVFLVLFNLIPAFPMDGGRVLRALLAMRLEYTRATQIAANIGQALALGFGFLGLFTNPFLLFIAFFVWIGAAQEASLVQMKAAMGGIPIARVMLTDFRTLAPGDPLLHAVQLTLAGSQKDFPVVGDGRVLGILTHAELIRALAEQPQHLPVSEVMQSQFEVAEVSEMVEKVFARLQACECHTMPVLQQGRLVGLVTMDNLSEFLRIQAALRR